MSGVQKGSGGAFQIEVTPANTSPSTIAVMAVDVSGVYPLTTNTFSLGTSASSWSNLYATKIYRAGLELASVFAPISHASNGTTYGLADASNYGHVKLYTNTGTSTDGTMDRNSITNGLNLKAAISGQVFEGDVTAPNVTATTLMKTPLVTNNNHLEIIPSIVDKFVFIGRKTADPTSTKAGAISLVDVVSGTPTVGFGAGIDAVWRTPLTPTGTTRGSFGIHGRLTSFTNEDNYTNAVDWRVYWRSSGSNLVATPLSIENATSTVSENGRLNIKAGITTFSGMANNSTFSLIRIEDSTKRLILSASEVDAIPYAQSGTTATGGARLHLNGNGSSNPGNCEVYLGSNANGTGNFRIVAAQPGSTSAFEALRCSQTSFELNPDNVTSFRVDAGTTHVYKDLQVDGASTLQGILTMSGTAIRSTDANYTIPESTTCLVNTANNAADRTWTLPTPWLGRILILANNSPSGTSGNIIVQAKTLTYLQYNTTVTLYRFSTAGRKGLILLGTSATQWVILSEYTL
jgi:hypothetical protein